MIRHISIRNFAIIRESEIDFHDGLNIITGETGAGKSIVIEAVSLALGSRADTTFVRSGCDKAVVQMIADDADGREYLLTREVSAAGRNLCRIDGELVTLGQLAAVSRRLADIHGQYDHQSLLDLANHLRLLDSYERDRIAPAKDRVAACYAAWQTTHQALKQLISRAAETARQRDFMAFELQELTEAKLQAGEEEALAREVRLLQNSESIYENLSGAFELVSGGDYTALSALKQAAGMVQQTGDFSQDLQSLADRLDAVYYELEDIGSDLRRQRDQITFSPAELDAKLARLDQIGRLTAKHGKTEEELIAYAADLSARLADIDDISGRQQALEAELAAQQVDLEEACQILSTLRREAAASLEEKISAELSQLSFADSRFAVAFRPADAYSAEGKDIAEFMISTNRGEPLKPLSKIASGGEMSRIMLAFKKIIADYDAIPAMIFDEIDAGISGVAASVVGRKMREIAARHQVICITHLPQIAAYGQHHYRIEKSSDETSTYTSVTVLTDAEKVPEIARLLGGETVTETTLRSAQELLEASR